MTCFRRALLALTALLCITAPVAAGTPQPAAQSATTPVAEAPPSGAAGHELTAQDVNTWLDGLMPYGLQNGDIAGAVVVVVKDGKILTKRGYGYADVAKRTPVDPDRTMFRVGSTSKLFTWTAVMQLVQQGKIDLDADVNQYLDFQIPPAFGKPITMRNLMTHTAGFEETLKHLINVDPKNLRTLHDALASWVPERIYPPGTVPAYSNYGATLAGYIVQRVSGEKFDDYIARHILKPLDMRHSTFAQPLPARFKPFVSKGYATADSDAQPFELIDAAPAGAFSTTGADIAQFMIAHLNRGGPLLDRRTAAMMHSRATQPIPGLPGMALGFYQEDGNGLNIIGHGGDTVWFHSDLHLYMDKGIGLFMSFNSRGKEDAAYPLRAKLFEEFTDRYFPVPEKHLPTASTAKAHGQAMAGTYLSSRRATSSWARLFYLPDQPTVSLNPDDTISVSGLNNAAGVPITWREVGPWQWHEVGGQGRLNAVVRDGKVVSFANAEFAPIMTFMPAPFALDGAWIIPALLIALVVLLVTVIAWPTVALVRRHYGRTGPLSGRPLLLHRLTRVTAALYVMIVAMWFTFVSLLSASLLYLDGRLDIWMRLAQLLAVIAIIGTGIACWNVWVQLRGERGWWPKLWSVVIALACLFMTWFVIAEHLIPSSLNY
ncbi:beta-lactamase family protein [Stakelama sp. CBK3Z-3]|uniref:Beta-lactamase family protein n=1 Tax=Stakelama flava TaxID=2860338 RepID=A0ABS6XPK8_9SPHN|nr:serine hydrolase domain-containing protein [Stakelama flava]MBW4332154.1 beta-lactamase family protein [Stakelama flava]